VGDEDIVLSVGRVKVPKFAKEGVCNIFETKATLFAICTRPYSIEEIYL
jgi:hypothetical protein